MQRDELPSIDPNEDLTQTCESRFMEFEHKIQNIEASLLILESQLSSIPGLENLKITKDEPESSSKPSEQNITQVEAVDVPDVEKHVESKDLETSNTHPIPEAIPEIAGTKAKDDPRYLKFFKMLQFGVPEPAVKLKMQNEGIDPSILDKPNDVIQEGI